MNSVARFASPLATRLQQFLVDPDSDGQFCSCPCGSLRCCGEVASECKKLQTHSVCHPLILKKLCFLRVTAQECTYYFASLNGIAFNGKLTLAIASKREWRLCFVQFRGETSLPKSLRLDLADVLLVAS